MANSSQTNTLPFIPRSTDNRVLAGVAGGIGARTGIEPDLIRAGFVVLTFAGGIGAVIYAIAWVFARDSEGSEGEPLESRQQVAAGIMFVGVLLLLRSIGLWFGDSIVYCCCCLFCGLFFLTFSLFLN